jgi:hypothetical protein
LALAEAGADVAVADLHPGPFEGETYFPKQALWGLFVRTPSIGGAENAA